MFFGPEDVVSEVSTLFLLRKVSTLFSLFCSVGRINADLFLIFLVKCATMKNATRTLLLSFLC